MKTPYKHAIDLLPESVQAHRRRKRYILKLAAVQVAIFLCLAGLVTWVRAIENSAWENSSRLSASLNTLRQYPANAHIGTYQEAVFFANTPGDFDPSWFTAIINANGGQMTSLSYAENTIMITGITDSALNIETHRKTIYASNIFTQVRLGRIDWQETGEIFYELWVLP